MKHLTCCVTGHRSIPAEQLGPVRQALERELDHAIADGCTAFLSGFAEGTDLLFAELVAEKMAENPALRLEAAIPYQGRLDALRKAARTGALLARCAEIHVAAAAYLPSVYAKRNRYMVERSDRVIAVYDGRAKGGTAGTVRLARAMGKDLRLIPLAPAPPRPQARS